MKVAIVVKLLCLWVTEGNLFEVFKSKIDVDTCKKREKTEEMKQKIFHVLQSCLQSKKN